jgi:hypothetical protein
MKALLNRVLGRDGVDRLKHGRDVLRRTAIRWRNRWGGVSFLNIGAGTDAELPGWWTGDVQTGTVIDETTRLPFGERTIRFAYSSMFFEHITDATADNLLQEVYRVLQPTSCFRIVVPDFDLYIRKYREGARDFFYSPSNQNFETWERKGVPVDMERLLLSVISQIQNLAHVMVSYPYQEDFTADPPRVCYPFQARWTGYYCGPAPEITSDQVRQKLAALSEGEFLDWVFAQTMASTHQDMSFNAWHKKTAGT